jgi:hypothetical protein
VTEQEVPEARPYFRLFYLLGQYFLLHSVDELRPVLLTVPHLHNPHIQAARMRVVKPHLLVSFIHIYLMFQF